MANEALVSAIKEIITLGKSGKSEEAYTRYRDLFADPQFLTYRPEDQRQALKLMVLAKNIPQPPPPIIVEAHQAALLPLTELVSNHAEPVDHEMLGACHVLLGHMEAASAIFKAGLAIERQRDPGSPLCGSLMKRVSEI